MVERQEVTREVVQTILDMAIEGGPVPVPAPILAALCRAWLETDDVERAARALLQPDRAIGSTPHASTEGVAPSSGPPPAFEDLPAFVSPPWRASLPFIDDKDEEEDAGHVD